VVVLIGGGFAYWGIYGIIRQQYRYAAVGISFLLIAFALFAMGGGELLERFVGLRGLVEGEASEDARVQFYRMTMAVVAGSPLAGFGLGNFEYVFPFYLDFEPMFDRRPVHPESSWLWLASEGGWLLLVGVAAAIFILFRVSFRARKSRASTMRSVGLACAAMLAFNAAFEVSAHRIGTLFPVIVLACLALPPTRGAELGAMLRRVAKAGGAILVVIGSVWLAGGWGFAMVPSVQGVDALQGQARAAKDASRPEEAIELLERCERFRPLDWNIHWTLSGWLLEQGELDPAWQEFRSANALLPYLYWTIRQGALKWMTASPGRAATAMIQALSRAPEAKRPEIYGDFLHKSADNPPLRAVLLRLFPENDEFELVRIRQAAPEVSAKRLKRLIAQTDNLSEAEEGLAASVLRLMLQRGQLEEIDAAVGENLRLKRIAWDVLFERELQDKRTKEALDIYFTYSPRPSIPALLNRSDLRSVERAAALAPMDISTSIAYYQALEAAQREDDAMWQLRRIMELPDAPAYIWFLAGQTAHRRGDYEEALAFIRAYQEKTKP